MDDWSGHVNTPACQKQMLFSGGLICMKIIKGLEHEINIALGNLSTPILVAVTAKYAV